MPITTTTTAQSLEEGTTTQAETITTTSPSSSGASQHVTSATTQSSVHSQRAASDSVDSSSAMMEQILSVSETSVSQSGGYSHQHPTASRSFDSATRQRSLSAASASEAKVAPVAVASQQVETGNLSVDHDSSMVDQDDGRWRLVPVDKVKTSSPFDSTVRNNAGTPSSLPTEGGRLWRKACEEVEQRKDESLLPKNVPGWAEAFRERMRSRADPNAPVPITPDRRRGDDAGTCSDILRICVSADN
jgi:ribosomal protein L17